jgi:hypothetical protein
MTTIEIGRLLRSSTAGCVVGCRVSQISVPVFGGMVRIPLNDDDKNQVIGLIYDIHIDDDGLVRQIVTAENVSEDIIQDNRANRNVPVEISVLYIGYLHDDTVHHLLPPRPPLTLDSIFTCSNADICRFTSSGRFGYFRLVFRSQDLPVAEILAAHLQEASRAHREANNAGWASEAVQELITLLRDDYPTLMSVLGSLADADLGFENAGR